jgi:hypothetical protein
MPGTVEISPVTDDRRRVERLPDGKLEVGRVAWRPHPFLVEELRLPHRYFVATERRLVGRDTRAGRLSAEK